jgi:hypothetical protein
MSGTNNEHDLRSMVLNADISELANAFLDVSSADAELAMEYAEAVLKEAERKQKLLESRYLVQRRRLAGRHINRNSRESLPR